MQCSTPELIALETLFPYQGSLKLYTKFSGHQLPDGFSSTGLVELTEDILVRSHFLRIGFEHRELDTAQVELLDHNAGFLRRTALHEQGILPARHVDVNIRQQLGIQQSAVQCAAGVVDFQAVAQGIQAVAFAGNISLAMTKVSSTPATQVLKGLRPVRPSSMSEK